MRLIAFAGYATSGKTTACKIIKDFINTDSEIYSFAEELKETASEMLSRFPEGRNIDVFNLYGKEKEQIRPFFVWLGEYARSKDKDCWINRLAEKINGAAYSGDTYGLIDDLRYRNEADWVIDEGGTIIYIDAGVEPPNEEEKKSLAEVRKLKKTYGGKQYFEIKNDKKSVDKLLSQIKGII